MTPNPQQLRTVIEAFEAYCQSALSVPDGSVVESRRFIDTFLNEREFAADSDTPRREIYVALSTILEQHLSKAEIDSDIETWISELTEQDDLSLGILPPMPRADSRPTTQSTIGLPQRYEPIEPIGDGGLGQIWRATDNKLHRTVAIKTLLPKWQSRPKIWQRLLREAELAGHLQHPGIPPLYDSGCLDNGVPFFSMKIVEGQTLSELIRQPTLGHGSSTHQLLTYFSNVAQTIAYAHSEGIIHRDLKPSNVMVGRFGEVQVMDWGLAKRLNVDEPDREDNDFFEFPQDHASDATPLSSMTGVGDVLGTPSYMPPEQARGDIESIDERSDIYSLGAILFEILTGRRLFDELADPAAVLDAARQSQLDASLGHLAAADVDESLKQLVRHTLAPVATQRPTATQLVDELSSYFELREERLREAQEEQTRATIRIQEEKKRRRIAFGLAGVLTAGIIGTCFGMYRAHTQWQRAESNALAATENKSLAIANAERAQENARVAEGNAIAAEKVVQDFYTRVSEEQLFDTPSLQLLRQQFLDSALEFYEQRLAESPDNLRLQLAYGNLLYSSAKATLSRGEIPQAYELNEQAIGQLESIQTQPDISAGDDERQAAAERVLGRAYFLRGATMMRMGKGPDCIEWFEKSEMILKDIAESQSSDIDARRFLAELYAAWGNLLTNSPSPNDAMPLFGRSKELREEVLQTTDADQYDRQALARTYWDIGYCQRLMSARAPLEQWKTLLTKAIENYDRSITMLEQLAAEFPSSLGFLTTLGDVYNTKAVALSHQNNRGGPSERERKANSEDALEAYLKSLAIKQRLVDQNPGIDRLAYNLGRAHLGIATQYKFLERLDEAETSLMSALAIRARLAEENPEEMQYQEGLANVLTNLGLLQLKQDKPKEAIGKLERAESIYQTLTQKAPASSRLKVNLSMSITNIALGKIELGEFESASTKMLEAKNANPDQSDLALTIARCQSQLATAAQNAESPLTESLKQRAVDSLCDLHKSNFLSADDLNNKAFDVLDSNLQYQALLKSLLDHSSDNRENEEDASRPQGE